MSIETKAKLKLLCAMFIYGTGGILLHFVSLPSAAVALFRSSLGAVFILLFLLIRRKKPKMQAIRKNLVKLALSGLFLGANWVCLFEAFRTIGVSTATLYNYMAPIIIVIASPILLKERLTLRKALCTLGALGGMVLISGFWNEAGFRLSGLLLGVASAVFYAGIVLLNKVTVGVPPFEKTFVQLLTAALVLLPYTLLHGDLTGLTFSAQNVILLLVFGLVHTGIAYALYFGSIEKIPAQTSAILSYTDPVVAIILSIAILHEVPTVASAIGAVLILACTMISELNFHKPKKQSV